MRILYKEKSELVRIKIIVSLLVKRLKFHKCPLMFHGARNFNLKKKKP